jgi:hypothetical protein
MAIKSRARIIVPPNMALEESKDRSLVISYGTAFIFALSIVLALIMFGVRYSESLVHHWNAQAPIQQKFWASRITAHSMGCSAQPCFAIGQRMDSNGSPIFGVNEYVLYVTDGSIALLALLLISGLVFLIIVLTRHPSRVYDLYE